MAGLDIVDWKFSGTGELIINKAMSKEKFSFYRDWQLSLKTLPDEQKLELYNAIVDYGLDGIESAVSPIVSMAMNFIKAQIDRNDEKIKQRTEQLRENGKLGGRPRKNQMVSEKPNGFYQNQENQKVFEKPNALNININNNNDINNKDIIDAKASLLSSDNIDNDNLLICKEEKLDIPQFINCWNQTVKDSIIPAIKSITGNRKESLNARFKQYGKENLYEAVKKVGESDFLKGNSSDKSWHATFDWFIKPRNFAKVLEGNYDNLFQESYGNRYTEDINTVQYAKLKRQAEAGNIINGFFAEDDKNSTATED